LLKPLTNFSPGKVKSKNPIDLRNSELNSIANEFRPHPPFVPPKRLEGGGTRFIAKVDKEVIEGNLLLPPTGIFMDFNTSRVLLSSIKRAESRDTIIIRLWNPYRVAETVTIKLPSYWNISGAYSCQINEGNTPLLGYVINI
jgi:hypothetical protein